MKKANAYIRTSTASRESSIERLRTGIEQLLKDRALSEQERRGSAFFDMVDDGDFREWLSRTRWPEGIREVGRMVLHRIVQHYNAKRESGSSQSR